MTSVCLPGDKIYPKWGLLLMERLSSDESEFFSVRVDSNEIGAKLKVTELLPLKVYPFTLRVSGT